MKAPSALSRNRNDTAIVLPSFVPTLSPAINTNATLIISLNQKNNSEVLFSIVNIAIFICVLVTMFLAGILIYLWKLRKNATKVNSEDFLSLSEDVPYECEFKMNSAKNMTGQTVQPAVVGKSYPHRVHPGAENQEEDISFHSASTSPRSPPRSPPVPERNSSDIHIQW